MDQRAKRKLIANMMPAIVPVAQAGVHYHFDRKLLDERQDHEIELAERRAQAMSAMVGEPASAGQTPARSVSGSDSPRVYDALSRLRQETQCGFCQSAADALMDRDRDTASRGLAELQEYQGYLEDARSSGVPQDQIETDVEDIVSRWEVVPGVLGGM